MTIGISKEDIEAIFDGVRGGDIHLLDVAATLRRHIKELDPWLPIEDAPRDRKILLFAGCPIIGWYNSINNT